MSYQYKISPDNNDPTFGGTRPLKHIEVSTIPQPGDWREARILENGVPVSAHWFKIEAERQAKERAINNGLDYYYIDGVQKTAK
jgi:hypothetical protein